MSRSVLLGIVVAALLPSCKKEEVKEYTVSLRATCYDCVVQYAAGPDRGRYDTLSGVIEGADTLRETGTYTLTMRENQAIFFRACRMLPDSGRFGSIDLSVDGDVQPMVMTAVRDSNCAVINQGVQFR